MKRGLPPKSAALARSPAPPTHGSPLVGPTGAVWQALGLAVTLCVFAGIAYGPAITLPFIGDDYVFLDQTRSATFWSLWSFENVSFEWYRPWSRELHFWSLQRLAGLHEPLYRAFSLLLWISALGLYASIVRRLTSATTAWLATLGVAALGLWGTPLLWISGSQDLWMLVFCMASLRLFITGRVLWSAIPFALALLSKETAAVLPALALGYAWIVEHRNPAAALRRTAPLWILLLTWMSVHPTLHDRLFAQGPPSAEAELRPAPWIIGMRTLLSSVNLDRFPRPAEVASMDVVRAVASVAALVLGAIVAIRRRPTPTPPNGRTASRRDTVRFGLWWAMCGWLPVLVPSISWHAYYACLGALGAWLLLGTWLENRRVVAVALIAFVALLRGAQAATPSWDWGNEWYQRRAGTMLSGIRDDLRRLHPTLPPQTRVFFGRIPNNIGLIAGQSPALRVWYEDPTLKAGFYSSYRSRGLEPHGTDLFFRFDSTGGMVEVHAGPEDVHDGLRSNPEWESDHEKLAMLFLTSGELRRAALEFEKVSLLPHRADAAGFAGVCWKSVGSQARADSLFATVRVRTGLSRESTAAWVERLEARLPRRK